MPHASLDTWTSLFFVASIFGVFFSSLFFLRGRHQFISVWPISVMIFGFSIVLFHYSLFWTGYIRSFPFLIFTVNAWFLAFGPLLYIYTAKFCSVPLKRKVLHFVPAFLSLVFSFTFYLQQFGFNIYEQGSFILRTLSYLNNPWLAVASMLIYLFFSLQVWRKVKSESFKKIVRNWIWMLHASFFVFILAYLSYYVLVLFPFFNQSWDYGISIGMTISIFTIGLFAYYEPAIFNGELDWLTKEKESSDFSDENSTLFYQQIVTLVNDDELFLNGNLRLVHLSDAVGLSLHDSSRIINLHSGKNFNQFINDFRVERAQNLLQTTDLSVKEICFVSGFNSKVSFYAAFKLKTNQTPIEYRKTAMSGD